MGNIKRLLISLLILLTQLFCGGRGDAGGDIQQSIVVKIETAGTYQGSTWRKTFTEPEKMEAVLHCLRRLQPSEAVDIDPESFRTDSCQVTLWYADGSNTVYRQLHNLYQQVDDGTFRQIREGAGTQLIQILYMLEEDVRITA